MRKYAYLKNPQKCNDKEYIYKIMLHTQKEGVYLYEYCSLDAIFCSYDQLYFDVKDILLWQLNSTIYAMNLWLFLI